jgi:hypothetical protein
MAEEVQTDPNVITGEQPGGDGPLEGEDTWLEANPLVEDDTQGTPPAEAQDASGKEAQSAGERERDAHGRFTSKTAPDSEDTTEPTASADGVNPEDLRKATNALKRSHTPQSVIDSLDPAKTVEWGLRLAATQAESDGFGKKVSDLKAELAKLAGTDSKAEPEPVDLDAKFKAFSDMFGDEAAEPLKALLEPILKASTTKPDSALAEKLEKLEALQRDRDQRDARKAIQAAWPEYGLDKDDRWDQLLASRRGDTREYSSEREALDTHRRLVFADEISADQRARLKETHKVRDDGQPTPPAGGTPPAAESVEALEERWLVAADEGNQAEKGRIEKLLAARRKTDFLRMAELESRVKG